MTFNFKGICETELMMSFQGLYWLAIYLNSIEKVKNKTVCAKECNADPRTTTIIKFFNAIDEEENKLCFRDIRGINSKTEPNVIPQLQFIGCCYTNLTNGIARDLLRFRHT